jgi:hypothetical protein
MRRAQFLSLLLFGSILSLLCACSGDDNAPAPPPPTILAPTLAGLFQPEGGLTVNFTITGTFESGNVFTAQLSDGTGSFSNPIAIGTLTAVEAGTIEATLPASVANGAGYRIRVVASTPETISPDNGANLSIAAPTITVSSVTTANANETFIPGRTLTITTALTGTFGTGNQFKLQLSDASGNFSSATVLATITNTVLDASLTGSFLPTTTQAGTGYRYRWLSTNPAINGTPSNPISVVLLTLSTPVVTGNLVAGGDILVSVNATNGPWFNFNQLRIQLSDASGNFTNPIDLRIVNTTLGGSQQNQSLTMTIPTNVVPGSGYRIRAETASPVVTSTATAAFSIGALPTLTLAAGTPTFTKLYSGTLYTTNYTLTVTKTGTFNANTSFRLQRTGFGDLLLTSTQITELTTAGSTVIPLFYSNTAASTLTYRVVASGHEVSSNQLQFNLTQTAVTSMSATIDAQVFNFSTNFGTFFNNTASGRNNQDILLIADEPTTMFGATSVRFFIGLTMTNENISTGSQTGRLSVLFRNSAGEVISSYGNTSVTMSVSGNPSAYTVSASGPFTLARTSTSGNASISVQSVSSGFKMQ